MLFDNSQEKVHKSDTMLKRLKIGIFLIPPLKPKKKNNKQN